MRIVIFLGFTNPFPGAGWKRVEAFADSWSRQGHEILILGSFSFTSFGRRGSTLSKGIKTLNVVFRIGLLHPIVFLFNFITSLLSCILVLICIRPDVMVVSVPTGDAGMGAMFAGRVLGLRYVVDYRDEWEDRTRVRANSRMAGLFYNAMKRAAARLYSDSILVAAVTSRFRDALRRSGTRSTLVPNGADITVFKPSCEAKSGNKISLVFAGTIGDSNDFDFVFRSMRALPDSTLARLSLVIAGYGPVSRFLQPAREFKLSDHVQYVGTIRNKRALANLIAGSDIGLIPLGDNPFLANTMPAKFFEYCACGIPILVSVCHDSLLEQMVRKYGLGESVEPGDTIGFARALDRLVKDNSFRSEAGKSARKMIVSRFDRSKISLELLKHIERCLAKGGGRYPSN